MGENMNKNSRKIIVFLLILIFIINIPSHVGKANKSNGNIIIWDKNLQGDIIQNNTTVGHADGNGYILLEKPYIVEKGIILKIEPGLIIEFGGNQSRLVINGTIISKGTQEELIIFSFKNKDIKEDTHNWALVELYESENSEFSYCLFNYSWYSIKSLHSKLIIENCTFSNVYFCPIFGFLSEIIIKNNVMTDNYYYPDLIHLDLCKAYIINNKIFNNEAKGIYLSTPEKTYIMGNVIEDNYWGVFIATTNSIEGMVTIKNNSIKNEFYNLYYYSLLYEINLDAEYNYWGSINKSEIKSLIEYHPDTLGFVDFEPWLDEKGDVYQDEITDPNKNVEYDKYLDSKLFNLCGPSLTSIISPISIPFEYLVYSLNILSIS